MDKNENEKTDEDKNVECILEQEELRFCKEDPQEIDEAKDDDVEDRPLSWYKRCVGLGLVFTFVKVILNCAADLLVKKLKHIHPVVLLFYRSMVMLSLCLPVSIGLNTPPFPSDRSLKERSLLVLRGVIGSLGAMASFYALQHMPLGDQKMLISCKPIFTVISARIFLKEPVGGFEIASTVLMMSGVVLVIKPAFLFGVESTESPSDSEFLPAALLLLGSTVLTANIMVILRYLRKENLMSILVSREIQFSIITFLVICFAGLPLYLIEPYERLQVLGVGVLCILTSILNLSSLKLEEANKIALVERSSAVVVAFAFQIIVFGDIPGLLTSIGIVLVLSAIIIIGTKKICFNKKTPKKVKTQII